jgi:gephyrin
MMARPVAGVRNQSLIITLPGSPKGAKENLEAIIKLLPHACNQAAGANSRALHAGGVAKLEKEAGISKQESGRSVDPYCEVLQKSNYSSLAVHTHSHDHHHHHHHGAGHAAPRPRTLPEGRSVHITNNPAAGPTQRQRKSPHPMLSVSDALEQIRQHVPKPRFTAVSMNEAFAHVLAEDVYAVESVPAFRASIVDGYAIRMSSGGSKFEKGVYPVTLVSTAHAGIIPELKEGTVARITTGAPLPDGADAVVMVEDTVLKTATEDGKEEKEVETLTSEIQKGENVRETGSDVKKGSLLLKAGDGISAIGGEFGMLASAGVHDVKVYQKPIIGVLSTGDELVHHNEKRNLKLGEVRDTNLPTLLSTIESTGFRAVDLGQASDQSGDLEARLRGAFDTHPYPTFVITTGGVSMGELDLLKPTVERALGGTIHFGRVSMKPGKPTTFATVDLKTPSTGVRDKKVIFGLPGNPASAVVTYFLFVLPALHLSSGISPVGLLKVRVVLDQDVRPDPVREEYHRVTVVARRDGMLYAISTGGQRSSRIGSFKGANGLLCLPAIKDVIKKGATMDALLMGSIISE